MSIAGPPAKHRATGSCSAPRMLIENGRPLQRVVRPRAAGDAGEDERRPHGHRRERVDRQAVATVRPVERHHGDPCGETPQARAQPRKVVLSHDRDSSTDSERRVRKLFRPGPRSADRARRPSRPRSRPPARRAQQRRALVVPAVRGTGAPEGTAAGIVHRPAQRLVVGIARVVVARVELDAGARPGRAGRRRTRWTRRGARARARWRRVPARAPSWSQARRSPLGSATQNARWCSRGPRPAVSATSWTVGLRSIQAPVTRSRRRRWRCTPSSESPSSCQNTNASSRRGECRLTWSKRMIGAPRCRWKSCRLRAGASWVVEELQRVAERDPRPAAPPAHARGRASPSRTVAAARREATRRARRGRASARTRKPSRATAGSSAGAGRASGAGAPPSREVSASARRGG